MPVRGSTPPIASTALPARPRPDCRRVPATIGRGDRAGRVRRRWGDAGNDPPRRPYVRLPAPLAARGPSACAGASCSSSPSARSPSPPSSPSRRTAWCGPISPPSATPPACRTPTPTPRSCRAPCAANRRRPSRPSSNCRPSGSNARSSGTTTAGPPGSDGSAPTSIPEALAQQVNEQAVHSRMITDVGGETVLVIGIPLPELGAYFEFFDLDEDEQTLRNVRLVAVARRRDHDRPRRAAGGLRRPPRRPSRRRRRPGRQGHRRRPSRDPPPADQRPRPAVCSPARSTTWPRRSSSASSVTPGSRPT